MSTEPTPEQTIADLRAQLARMQAETARLDWLEKHADHIVLDPLLLQLSIREKWDSRDRNRRQQIDTAMQSHP